MTAELKDYDDIMAEFLAAELTEPTRSGKSNRHTNTSESFNGDGSRDAFALTNTKLLCIKSVTVDSVAQTKYQDYGIDLRNSQIIFKSGSIPGAGSNNVVIAYDYNTSGYGWVYPGKAREELKDAGFPRISCQLISASGERLGGGDTDTEETILLQIDILARKSQLVTTDAEVFEGEQLVKRLQKQVSDKIEVSADMFSAFFSPKLVSKHPVPFDEPHKIFRYLLEYNLTAFNQHS